MNKEMAHELQKRMQGEVRVDNISRLLYSTDASIYQVQPLGVAFPRASEDLFAIVEFSLKNEVPILARGSGSSLGGQAVGPALVIDCSKHLNNILIIDPESSTAVVEPGVILDTLNEVASIHGLKFGPDPASSDRATFGGMIGNNSAGAHSILYGMTSDHVLSLDVILSDGASTKFQSVTLSGASTLAKKPGVEGEIYRVCLDIRKNQKEAIHENWPRTWRRSSGYGLNYLLPWSPSTPMQWQGAGEISHYPPVPDGHINLAPVVTGSEGTLAIFNQATVNLVKKPLETIIGVLAFDSVAEACDVTPAILELDPSAVELVPRSLINRAKSVPAYSSKLSFVTGNPAALLLIEFAGDDRNLLIEKSKKLGSEVILASTGDQQKQIWEVRKVGLGLLMSIVGDSKPLPFIEDVAVPVEHLGEFVRGIEYILENNDVTGDFYAHASVGCLHIRPLINLKSKVGVNAMREIAYQAVKLALKLGGALSGEHGDGLARSEWLEMVYGPDVFRTFRALKHAADPTGILNPGKIIDPPPMDLNLRYGADYNAKTWEPEFDFSGQGSLLGAVEMCNGAGVCRKDGGVMCPSFQAIKEEMHNTRGRANLLRAMFANKVSSDELSIDDVSQALDLCLECKGCKSECPSAVDMAKLKYEFLNFYYENNRRPIRDYVFAYFGELAQFGRYFAIVVNRLLETWIVKRILDWVLGISRHRELPKLKRESRFKVSGSPNRVFKEEVIFLPDLFTEIFFPELKISALNLMNSIDCKVHILPVVGSGRTMISKGFLKRARKHAQKVVDAVKKIDPQGSLPIIGIEPSEIISLKDEYQSFFPNDQFVRDFAGRCFMIDEFLIRPRSDGKYRLDDLKLKDEMTQVILHGHCYQKTQLPIEDGLPAGIEATVTFLERTGCNVEVIDSGCCGMAGSFGYEAHHFDLSMKIGEMALFPAVREKKEAQIVVAPGVSCRAQIKDGTGQVALHPISVVERKLIS